MPAPSRIERIERAARPERGQQLECNAPLSAAQVRVDKNVAPAPDAFGAHDGGAHEAARREQLRAFQASLLERIKQQEATKRAEQRAAAARLAAMQDLECERARALAATTSIQLAKALRVAPSPKSAAAPREPAPLADKAAADEAARPARPASKLQLQVTQTLGAVRAARARLRARTVSHQPADDDGDDDDDDDDDDGAEARDDGAALRLPLSASSESESEGEEALTFELPVATPRAPSPRASKPTASARARARERPSDVWSSSGAPADARGRRVSTAPYESASALTRRASLPPATPQWGRSPEALAVFESVRRAQLAAERSFSRGLAHVRAEADEQRRRRRAAAEAEAAEHARREIAAEAAERSASAPEAAQALARAAKVSKAAQRTRALQQAARYSDALRATLKEKVDQLARPLPSLCACGLHPLDDHVTLCAHNCALRGNPRAYALALSRLLVANGAGHLLDGHATLPDAKLRAPRAEASARPSSVR